MAMKKNHWGTEVFNILSSIGCAIRGKVAQCIGEQIQSNQSIL